jgi:hypothetical protein
MENEGGGMSLNPRDWLMIYLALPDDEGVPPKEDPIRIQKGMFLLSEEGGLNRSERYTFIPYNYGACSFDIYRDLDALVEAGLIERSQEPWASWPTYRPTAAGQKNAAALMHAASNKTIEYLRKTKLRLFKQSFVEMLREIYKAYPKYAVKSLVKLT